MKISTIKSAMLSLALLVFTIGFSTDANAQYKTYGVDIVKNGDFSAGSEDWVIEGDRGTVTHDDTLKFEYSSSGNPWELQSYQSLTAEQIAALAQGGDWELSLMHES